MWLKINHLCSEDQHSHLLPTNKGRLMSLLEWYISIYFHITII